MRGVTILTLKILNLRAIYFSLSSSVVYPSRAENFRMGYP